MCNYDHPTGRPKCECFDPFESSPSCHSVTLDYDAVYVPEFATGDPLENRGGVETPDWSTGLKKEELAETDAIKDSAKKGTSSKADNTLHDDNSVSTATTSSSSQTIQIAGLLICGTLLAF